MSVRKKKRQGVTTSTDQRNTNRSITLAKSITKKTLKDFLGAKPGSVESEMLKGGEVFLKLSKDEIDIPSPPKYSMKKH